MKNKKIKNLKRAMKRHGQKLKKAKSDRKQKIKDLKEAIKDNDEISKREILKELQEEKLKPISIRIMESSPFIKWNRRV